MIIPVRCFTCGKPVSRYYSLWLEYIANEKKTDSADRRKFFEEYSIKRYCCRTTLATSTNLMDKV